MIIPIKCKSCGKIIGHLWEEYLRLVHEYQDKRAKGEPTPDENETEEALALDQLNIDRYCCRSMILCQPENLVDYIRNRKQ